MDLRKYWTPIRSRLWLPLALMLLLGSSAFSVARRQPLQYLTTTMLYLKPGATVQMPFEAPMSLQALANTYTALLGTHSFARQVSQKLGGVVSEQAVQGSLAPAYVGNTPFFQISAVHTTPKVAQDLANAAAEVLISENILRQQAQQEQALRQRDAVLSQQQQPLNELQRALQDELASSDEQRTRLRQESATWEAMSHAGGGDQELQALRTELRSVLAYRVGVITALSRVDAALATRDAATAQPDNATIVDRATLPEAPVSSSALSSTLLAMLCGLVAGVGLSLALDYIDVTVKTRERLEELYQLPVAGVIGMATHRRGPAGNSHRLVGLHDPRSPAAEAFRALRTSIQTAALSSPIRSLLVTSAAPGEGKSFVASNLAMSLASIGMRVILVDGDLRKPTQHVCFGLGNEHGFSDLVSGKVELGNALRETGVPGLRLLPCGTLPAEPAELLGSHEARKLMAALADQADIVVYDSPPAATVTDAAVLALRVDASLQVVAAGVTHKALVVRCKTLLEQTGVRMLGPALNRAQGADLDTYGTDGGRRRVSVRGRRLAISLLQALLPWKF